ncbi:BRCA1-A complex subunit RAP80 isoform X2 [Mixophyes fleayi]|uniref:BRCA1-A complex subunit RAP80 isoform X2 n=1 Tax=Mixophyes fleayi TaxID=3061075 RepID=UPI003F4D9C9D
MHRRRKRKSRADEAGSQYVADEEYGNSERRIDVGFENRTGDDPPIVISDSDDMELEDESILSRKSGRPQNHRKTLAVKRKIAHMTEEEQLALAVKISQQEQENHVKYKQEEVDELLKKAIQDSLHSCRVPDISTSVTAHELINESYLSKEDYTGLQDRKEELPLSQISKISGESSSKSPVVLLKRLSQDIVKSSSVILSPNLKCPVSYIESSKVSPLSLSSSIDLVNLSPCKAVALSPVFPLKSPCPRRLIPCRLFQDNSPSAVKLPDEIDDQCSHCSESSQLDSISVLLTSNQSEFSKEDSLPQIEGVYSKNLCNDNTSTLDKREITSVDRHDISACRGGKGQKNEGTVHYYWGVPFCPKGENPSEYTKVILCQLEVYQKSLKQAQRNIMHKMEYGQPIQLTASCQSSSEHLKGNCSQEDDTEEIIDDCDVHNPEQSEKGQPIDSDGSETQHVSNKRQKVFESPVAKLLKDDSSSTFRVEPSHSQALFTKVLPSECEGVTPVALGESAVSPTVERSHRHLMEHTEDALDEEVTICPETQPSPAREEDSGKEDSADLTEPTSIPPPNSVPQACFSNGPPAEDIVCLDQICPKNVECPMCGCIFSWAQIERHAANCDGTNSQQEMAVLRPRHKPMRRSHAGSDDRILSSASGKYEKCYLCKSVVPLRDYQAHVDNCLQTAVLETEGSQRLRSIKGPAGRDGRLLSMLEQSESTSEGEFCSKQGLPRCSTSASDIESFSKKKGTNSNAQDPSYMSPPREEHSGNFSSEHLNFSDSPIRSFVSISEAKDCLVDFKKQLDHKRNSKGPSRRGKRQRM